MLRLALCLFALAFATAQNAAAQTSVSQTYPSRTIRIVTSEAGTAADLAARLIAQGISGPLGQPVIVDNRPGVNSADIVAKAAPDGYTIYVAISAFWLSPYLHDNLPWDPIRDFVPITLAMQAPNVVLVNPSLPVKSIQELIALIRAQPGKLNFASAQLGSSSQLAGSLFFSMTDLNVLGVPFKGSESAMASMIGGETQIGFPAASTAIPLIKSGQLRALAVTSAKPSALLPDLPTVASSGLPGYESASMQAVFAPAKTPPAIVNRLNQEIVKALNLPETKQRLFNAGVEIIGASPEATGTAIRSEMERMSKIIKEARLKEK